MGAKQRGNSLKPIAWPSETIPDVASVRDQHPVATLNDDPGIVEIRDKAIGGKGY